jgi:hypothetical protein
MKTYEVSLTYEEYFHIMVEVENGECPEEKALEQIREQEPSYACSGEFEVYSIRKDGETVWEAI